MQLEKDIYKKLNDSLETDQKWKEQAQKFAQQVSDYEMVLSNHRAKIAEAQRTKELLEHEVGQYDAQIKSLEEQIASAGNQRKEQEDNKQRLLGEKDGIESKLALMDFWLDGFSNYGIKDFCFGRLVGFLNTRLMYYCQKLTHGDVEVLFEKDSKDKIRVNVNCRDGAAKYITSSGGQERRADLCIALAFQSVVESGAQPVNIAVIDEFDAGLDEEGLNMFIDYLNGEARRKGSVFLITHNPALSGSFDKVMTVDRVDGVSQLNGGNGNAGKDRTNRRRR